MKSSNTLWKTVLLVVCVTFFFSCKNNKTTLTSERRIIGFYFFQNGLQLRNAVFTINPDTFFTFQGVEYSGFIQNRDSLPFKTAVDKITPIIALVKEVSKIVINDVVTYSGKDTLSFEKPVRLRVFAQNIDSTQLYLVKTNVHKIDHELYIWEQRSYPESIGITTEQALFFKNKIHLFRTISGNVKLHTSLDAKSWTEETLSGLSGTVEHIVKTPSKLYFINGSNLLSSEDGKSWNSTGISGFTFEKLLFSMGEDIFAFAKDGGDFLLVKSSDAGATWRQEYSCPTDLPVQDYSVVSEKAPSGKYRIALIGGTDKKGDQVKTVWSTENGSYWVNFSKDGKNFPMRKNATALSYDHNILLFGGLEKGVIADSVLISPNFGFSWDLADQKTKINRNEGFYTAGTDASVVVDETNFRIYLLGGKKDGAFIQKAWTGRKNETYFSEYQ